MKMQLQSIENWIILMILNLIRLIYNSFVISDCFQLFMNVFLENFLENFHLNDCCLTGRILEEKRHYIWHDILKKIGDMTGHLQIPDLSNIWILNVYLAHLLQQFSTHIKTSPANTFSYLVKSAMLSSIQII